MNPDLLIFDEVGDYSFWVSVDNLKTSELRPGYFIPGVGKIEWIEKVDGQYVVDMTDGRTVPMVDNDWPWQSVEMRRP